MMMRTRVVSERVRACAFVGDRCRAPPPRAAAAQHPSLLHTHLHHDPYHHHPKKNHRAHARTKKQQQHQTGLVCDVGLTLGDLIGTLREFFSRLGLTKLRFKPAYNPYTEPSMEIFRCVAAARARACPGTHTLLLRGCACCRRRLPRVRCVLCSARAVLFAAPLCCAPSPSRAHPTTPHTPPKNPPPPPKTNP